MRTRLADYIFRRLPDLTGSDHCFFLSGGGIMHLIDAMAKSAVRPVAMQHEQAAVIAADAFGRVNNTVGLALVTTGPGATNAVTGVAGAWMESTPILVISGQVSRANWKHASGVRQLGFQEIDILPVIRPITKFSALVMEPSDIRYYLEKAIHIARTGRPGPVWLDIPLDVQGAMIDEEELRCFSPTELNPDLEPLEETRVKADAVLRLIERAQRPLIVGGHGVWLSGSKTLFREVIEKIGAPVQTTWNGIDLLEDDHPLYTGRANSYGPRSANFIIQNCDLLVTIGARLGIQHIGYNYKAFAREAYKVMVDVDRTELHKHTLRIDLPVHADARVFLELLSQGLTDKAGIGKKRQWIDWCQNIRQKYPSCGPEHYEDDGYVDPYVFFEALSNSLPSDALIIPGSSGTGFSSSHQVFKIKRGQRFFSWKGLAAMGYGLPSAIGGCFGSRRKDTITVIGDGGFQLNIQELATISGNRLPIKLFVLNNQGYLSIRVTQKSYFDGRYVGSDHNSGVWLPPLERICFAYDLPYRRIETMDSLGNAVELALAVPGPVVCEVMLNPDKGPLPKLGSRKRLDGTMESNPLEELVPALPDDQFRSAMIIKPWGETSR